MRILIAHESPCGAGGVESYLAAVMPALAARGHQVGLVHKDSRSKTGPVRLDRDVFSVSVSDEGLDVAMARIAEWAPDVCFSHNMGALDVDDALLRWPIVKMMHGYFGTCVSGHKSHRFPGTDTCERRFGAPCLALYFPRGCGELRPLRMASQYAWTSRQHGLLSRYTHVVVASRHMADEYSRHGVAGDRLTSLPLFPTETAPAAPRTTPVTPTIVYAGRMTPLKGGDVLVRAVAEAAGRMAQPVKLVLAGDGPERDRWRELARACGLRVECPGWLTGAERTALFRSASVLAVPSLWPEPFGLVGLEAAVHGVPAVAFDVGGISEWLTDGVNGRLVRTYADAGAMGQVLAELLESPAEIARLGDGAVLAARRLNAASHLDALETVLARAAGRPQ